GAAPTAATRSPDGKYFLVAADGLYMIDTSNDSVLTPGGLTMPGAASYFTTDQGAGFCFSCWIAVTRDSQYAFVLTNSAFGSQVTGYNLVTRKRIGLQLNVNRSNSISISPTGTLYVSGSFLINAFDPSLITSAPDGSTRTCTQVSPGNINCDGI